jgi:hypothetical protein
VQDDKLAQVMNAGATVVNAGTNSTNNRRSASEADTTSRPVSERVEKPGGVAANGPGAFAKSGGGKKRREAKAKAKAEAEAEAAAVVDAAAVPKPWWRFGF